jgi:uncharacterized membrane protein YcaP (DUF421 family)
VWFDSWNDLVRILLVGTATYVVLVMVLRLSGKRTLSQLNAFDFVVTVALGSTLATVLLSRDVSWAEGFTALALLAALQYLVALIASRRPRARARITSEPALLLADGRMLPDSLRTHRLTDSELHQALRMQGIGDPTSVKAVVLETNGTISVITAEQYGDGSTLEGVRGAERIT